MCLTHASLPGAHWLLCHPRIWAVPHCLGRQNKTVFRAEMCQTPAPPHPPPHFRAHVTYLTVHGLQAAPWVLCFVDTIRRMSVSSYFRTNRFLFRLWKYPIWQSSLPVLGTEGWWLPPRWSSPCQSHLEKPRGLTPAGNTQGFFTEQEVGEPGFLHQSQMQNEKRLRPGMGRGLPGGPGHSAHATHNHKLQRGRKIWGSYEIEHRDAEEKSSQKGGQQHRGHGRTMESGWQSSGLG